jgi:hypothetical protein
MVVVTASNAAGSASAASPQLGPVRPALPTMRQIKASLGSALTPSRRAARIVALLKKGHYSFSFKAPEAGQLRITWWLVPKGLHSRHSPKPILVATGQLTFSTAHAARVTVNLTSAGKILLEHANGIGLTARGSFTPPGQPATIATEIISLRR